MSDVLGIGTMFGSGLSFIGGLIQNQVNKNIAEENIAYQREANEANLKYLREANAQNIAFQQRENEITRSREDNAVQRAAADMQAAGLSKTLAAGNPASASALSAPQVQAGSVKALSNQFKYESALQKLNLGQLMLDMAAKKKQLDINEGVAEAQVANINADTAYKNTVTENYAKDLEFSWDLKAAQAENARVNSKRVEAETKLYDIRSEYEADQIMADIGYKISQTDLNYSSIDLNTSKINEISQNIAESVARENKLKKEEEELVYKIVYADLQNKSLRHNISYAEKYGLPVSTVLPGFYGNAAQTLLSLGNASSSFSNPKGELIWNSSKPFSFGFKGIVPSGFDSIGYHTSYSPGASKKLFNKLF